MSQNNNYDSDKTLIIYTDNNPDVYAFETIYDPDVPTSGKVVPSVNSLIVKNDTELWIVVRVDPTTYKSTLKPIHVVVSSEDEEVSIISYGNDKYALFQDARTDPHLLTVDAKLLFFGNNLINYSLYRVDQNGDEECISVYLDAAGNFISDRIPMRSTEGNYVAYKWPSNCHCTTLLTEGQPIILRVFNNLGNISAEIVIYVRDATWFNDLSSHTNPIVGMDAVANQMRGSEFFLYTKQDPSHLNIQPYLIYADGTKLNVNVDNVSCFIYGLDEFIPSYPGYSQQVLIKYFLNYKESALTPDIDGKVRTVSCSKRLVILNNIEANQVKLVPIPLYNEGTKLWSLKFFAYSDLRNQIHDVTHLVNYKAGRELDGSNMAYGKVQELELEFDLQSVFFTDEPFTNVQSLCIILRDNTEYEKYVFKDNMYTTVVYGTETSIMRRPIIHYDAKIDQYFIPAHIFENWDAVMEAFYIAASPLFNTTIETVAPTPTHFTIRTVGSGAMVIASPIPVSEYKQAWSVITACDPLLGSTIIVEFLREINNEFQILYGVPVDVVATPTGFLSE